jgi:hypothetical protein
MYISISIFSLGAISFFSESSHIACPSFIFRFGYSILLPFTQLSSEHSISGDHVSTISVNSILLFLTAT